MKLTPTIRASKETTQALRHIAHRLGFILKSGTLAGEGDVPAMLEAVARGELEIRPVASPVVSSEDTPSDRDGS